ncbi:hypothetical protein [Streptomyces sp. N35]|uniref:hypothetical protein n=1 Tax=Streptomyces sp. N35 TaxID=2795730 RepID=UPI0018F7CA1F|nr:hypothetical protein [Streptomyces sp. N35]
MRGVRRLATLLGTLVAGLALVLLGAPCASAGGPTSVLLSSPTSGGATALNYQDKEYEQLWKLLGVGRDVESVAAPPMDDTMDGSMINATWMIHDVEPWRVDQIHVIPPAGGEGDDKVFLHTSEEQVEDRLDSSQGKWHRPAQPGQLLALLDDLGLLGTPGASGSDSGDGNLTGGSGTDEAATAGSGADEATTAGSGADETAGVGQAAGADASDAPGARGEPAAAGAAVSTGWWWVFPGIAAGAALALGIRPIARQLPTWSGKLLEARSAAREARTAAREEGPRGELIDR